jgi:hypothetical protein
MSLYIAYRIAVMYSEAGQHEMAMKWVLGAMLNLDVNAHVCDRRFFERISKNYQRECWDPIIWSVRDTWYDCAQRTGSVETAVRLLLQMMSPGKRTAVLRRCFWLIHENRQVDLGSRMILLSFRRI